MSLGMQLDVYDGVSSVLGDLAAGLEDRIGLNEAIGDSVRNLVIDHLTKISETRHDTAEELGAQPTGHWEDPASYTERTATEEGATVSIRKPGIGRAAHDVTIEPGEDHEWLALPLLAEAYGQRAYRIPDLFFVQPKGKDYALLGRRTGSGKDAQVSWLYLLVESVFQKQDPTLLPTEEEFRVAALQGARDYVDYLLRRSEIGDRRSGGRN